MSRADMGQEVSGSGRVETPVGILEVAWAGDCLFRLDLLYAPDTQDADGAPASDWAPTRDQATAPDRGIASDRVTVRPPSPQPSPARGEGARESAERLNDSLLPVAIRAALERYFRDGRAGLDLPLAPAGTPFQHRVWQALRAIPPGSTRTYGELARELGTSARAIGGACRANPCLIAVPCHRVVARDGLGGFAGERGGKRLAVKRWLLRHEGAAAGRLP